MSYYYFPQKRQKLYDMRHGDREPTPESESPSPYSPSPVKKEGEPRWPFPKKARNREIVSLMQPLPHANRFGAIRPRPFVEDEAMVLSPAPEIANWRPKDPGWFFRIDEQKESSENDEDEQEDEQEEKEEVEDLDKSEDKEKKQKTDS